MSVSQRVVQPDPVRLPRRIGEQRIPKHPILLALKKARRAELARRIGIRPHGLLKAEQAAAENRDHLIPASWVKAYALATGLPPFAFRPDLFEAGWEYQLVVEQRDDQND